MKKSYRPDTHSKLAEARTRYLSSHAEQFDHWMDNYCESPIEQLFLASMLESGYEFGGGQERWSHGASKLIEAGAKVGPKTLVLLNGDEGVSAFTQAPITVSGRDYRLDFVFLPSRARTKFVVELDGHDFHERTKQQARRDKSRDRVLAGAGWTVLRFTGSEVYEDADRCLMEIGQLCHNASPAYLAAKKAAE